MIATPTRKKAHYKIIVVKPTEYVQNRNIKNVREFRDKTVLNFIYSFFFIACFCFVTLIVNFNFFTLKSSGKLTEKYSAVFPIALTGSKVKLILKLLIIGTFLGHCHRHLLYLWNESMTSIAYSKSYRSEGISYTAHSTT